MEHSSLENVEVVGGTGIRLASDTSSELLTLARSFAETSRAGYQAGREEQARQVTLLESDLADAQLALADERLVNAELRSEVLCLKDDIGDLRFLLEQVRDWFDTNGHPHDPMRNKVDDALIATEAR